MADKSEATSAVATIALNQIAMGVCGYLVCVCVCVCVCARTPG